MERPGEMTPDIETPRVSNKNKSTTSTKVPEEYKKPFKSGENTPASRSRGPNLKIFHAYVHASLFKEFQAINPIPLKDGKWRVEISFKNQMITPEVDSEKDMLKVCKKVLEYQKKYGNNNTKIESNNTLPTEEFDSDYSTKDT